MATRFYLVRHGNTKSNTEDRFRGRLDVPLDETGREQARLAGLALKGSGIGIVYTSPLSRAAETGAIVAAASGVGTSIHGSLIDFDFGEWSGKLRSEVKVMWPELYEIYEKRPADFATPGGESLRDVESRISNGLEDLVSAHPSGTIALVSHAVTCRILILHLLGLTPEKYWNVSVDNCSISVFSRGKRGWVLESLNATGHLARA